VFARVSLVWLLEPGCWSVPVSSSVGENRSAMRTTTRLRLPLGFLSRRSCRPSRSRFAAGSVARTRAIGLGLRLGLAGAVSLSLSLALAFGSGPPEQPGSGAGREARAQANASTVAGRESDVGRSYRVPYRLTDTNHFLVRARINGKGPFNFLVDTGAPAFYIATETAKAIDLKPTPGVFWTPVDRLEFEGGASLSGIKARVEDPFQLVGMNALGLPGASIDGLMGYTVLARFRITLDPTQDRMTWTRLDFNPPDPPAPQGRDAEGNPPLEIQAMNALGPLAKGLAFLMGKQAEDDLRPRGYLGIEWSDVDGEGNDGPAIRVDRVLEGSPAALAGLKVGDILTRIRGRAFERSQDARVALAEVLPGTDVPVVVRRGSGPDARELSLTIQAGEGL
jgi:hypothetical protein